jgi:transglutaminase-like putative cysteine protease
VSAETFADDEDLYLLEQQVRYTYASPVRRLRHRLIVVPRAVHGGQHRCHHGLTVSGVPARMTVTSDSFANHVVDLRALIVSEWIEFDAWALVRTRASGGVVEVPPVSLDLRELLAATPLTRANDILTGAARDLSASSSGGLDLAERACAWSHQALTYEHDVTSVRTDAATALAGGKGVCQDYAHVMLALCRAAGLPARYVSGHMVGEGGSHAWVEVVVGEPSRHAPGRTVAVAFDPTHNRRASRGYITVAVGRDYDHVAPTSGTFEGGGPSVLSIRKRLSRVNPDAVADDAIVRQRPVARADAAYGSS